MRLRSLRKRVLKKPDGRYNLCQEFAQAAGRIQAGWSDIAAEIHLGGAIRVVKHVMDVDVLAVGVVIRCVAA